MPDQPGQLVLFGSGETAASGRKVFEEVFQNLPSPARVAILETPGGFEPNTAAVAGRIAEFLKHGLQNYTMEFDIIPARQRGTAFSPDDPALAERVLTADCIVLGPGSPTYAVRQLSASVVWDAVRLRFATGATLVLASASVLAVSTHTLPVYEIYKAGADVGWENGLDLLGPAGLNVAFVPHWNNREGGADLDTCRCYMGVDRFARLQSLLPSPVTIVGIDEHTALIVDPESSTGRVEGRGSVTLQRGEETRKYKRENAFALSLLGDCDLTAIAEGVPSRLRDRADQVEQTKQPGTPSNNSLPPEVLAIVERREKARSRQDWATADALRDELAEMGYQLRDTPNGPELSETEESLPSTGY
jgi:cyanophycinase-like exopeptidase